MLGIPTPNDEAVREKLKNAIELSREKKYHGNADSFSDVPKPEVQALTLLDEGVKVFEYYNEESKTFLDE